MADDIELLVLRGRLKVNGDRLELRLRGPGGARWKPLASVLQLALAHGVGRVDVVQLVPDIRVLEYAPEPRALRPGVAGKVEHDRQALRQERAHVWRQRALQPGGALDEARDVGDLTRKQVIQELVLHD